MPVAAGLATGIAFMIILASVLSSSLLNVEPDTEPKNIVLEFDEASLIPQYPDGAKVYIFPWDMNGNMTIDDLDWELGIISGVQFAYGQGDHFGVSKLGIYDVNGTIIVPNATEFYTSPDLKKSDGSTVTVEDMYERQKFGNGIQIGEIMLEPKGIGQIVELVPAITFVVAEPDTEKVDANIDLVRSSIEDPKLVKVSIPEGASLEDSGKTYDPKVIKVIIGYNNTVRWVNNDSTYHYIEADDDTDLDFYRKTTYANSDASRRNLMHTSDSFVFTFTTAGEIAYHGMPHLRGTVIVLEKQSVDWVKEE